MSFSWLGRAGLGRVDPDGIGQRRGPRRFADEALGMLLEGCGQDALAVVEDAGGEPVVNHVRRQQGDTAVVMLVVIPYPSCETIWPKGWGGRILVSHERANRAGDAGGAA